MPPRATPPQAAPQRASSARTGTSAWVAWLPYLVVAAAHLLLMAARLVLGADLEAQPPLLQALTQSLLMPALALVPLSRPRSQRGPAWRWIFCALAGSWVGDTLPRFLEGDAAFLGMVAGFAVAQVFWIIAFTRSRGAAPPRWYVAALGLTALALLAAIVPRAGVLSVAVLIYGLLLAGTAFVAARHGTRGMVGGALFVVSDGLIALSAFVPAVGAVAATGIIIMATYIAAQALLTAAAR